MSVSLNTFCLYELALITAETGPFVQTISINSVSSAVEAQLVQFNGFRQSQTDERGIFSFSNATEAARFAVEVVGMSVQSQQGELAFRISLATASIDVKDPDPESEMFLILERLNKMGFTGTAIADQTTFLAMDRDRLPWVEHKGISEPEFPSLEKPVQLIGGGQCKIHRSLQEVLRTQPSKVIIKGPNAQVDIPRMPDAKHHVIFSGYKWGSPSLESELSKIPAMMVSSNIWYQTSQMSLVDRHVWKESGKQLIISSDDAMLEAIATAKLSSGASVGSATVMGMDLLDAGDMILDSTGLALPRVPLQGLIQSYSFDMLSSGEWGFASSQADRLLSIDIQPEGVFLTTTRQDVTLSGRVLRYGQRMPIRDGALIRTVLGTLRFIAFSGNYCGIIVGITSNSESISKGERFEIGREPSHPGLVLPVRGGEDRIMWMNSSKAQRAKNSGWTWDRSWVGRRQTMIQISENDDIFVSPIHDRLPTLLYSNGKLIPLTRQTRASFGDMVIIGTSVFSLSRP